MAPLPQNFWPPSNFFGFKKNVGQNKFWYEKNFDQKNIGKKNDGPKKKFGPKKSFGPKNVVTKRILVRKKKNNIDQKKKFGPRKNFDLKKFWSEKILVQKKIWSKKSVGPKKFSKRNFVWRKILVRNLI